MCFRFPQERRILSFGCKMISCGAASSSSSPSILSNNMRAATMPSLVAGCSTPVTAGETMEHMAESVIVGVAVIALSALGAVAVYVPWEKLQISRRAVG